MRAVVWHGKYDVRVDEVSEPIIKESTDAIVRITATGLCGSDLHLYEGLIPTMNEGDVIGHEPVGIVEEVGSDVEHIRPGQRVVVPPNIACGSCFMCGRGLHSQCEATQNLEVRKAASVFGFSHLYGGVDGGQAEYLRVPHARFGPFTVPDHIPDAHAVLFSDVIPTAWQAVAYSEVEPGETLGIVGLGPIGQMCARIGRYRGVERIIGVDKVGSRLAAARAHGVETVDVSTGIDPVEVIKDMTGGRGVDRAIDAVGMEADGSMVDQVLQRVKLQPDRLTALHQALGITRRGGTLSIIGTYVGPMYMFPLGDLFDRHLSIRMGQLNGRRWTDEILRAFGDADPLGLDGFVTHTMPLERAPDAYAMFQQKAEGVLKIVFTLGR